MNNAVSPPPAIAKRNHALVELLSSERAYTSDLAWVSGSLHDDFTHHETTSDVLMTPMFSIHRTIIPL